MHVNDKIIIMKRICSFCWILYLLYQVEMVFIYARLPEREFLRVGHPNIKSHNINIIFISYGLHLITVLRQVLK